MALYRASRKMDMGFDFTPVRKDSGTEAGPDFTDGDLNIAGKLNPQIASPKKKKKQSSASSLTSTLIGGVTKPTIDPVVKSDNGGASIESDEYHKGAKGYHASMENASNDAGDAQGARLHRLAYDAHNAAMETDRDSPARASSSRMAASATELAKDHSNSKAAAAAVEARGGFRKPEDVSSGMKVKNNGDAEYEDKKIGELHKTADAQWTAQHVNGKMTGAFDTQREAKDKLAEMHAEHHNTTAFDDEKATYKKDFSTDERKDLAKEGKAMPDGSYPITNGSDLEHAIELSGMGSAPKDKIHAHIKARAKDLGMEDKIPNSWKAEDKTKCPECGSKKYSLMPTDFETAKCAKCGKTWDHGIVDGVNNPYDAKKFEEIQKAALASDPLQSNPATTDTTQEDPAVDGLKKPVPYIDVMRLRHPSVKLKKPVGYLAGMSVDQRNAQFQN